MRRFVPLSRMPGPGGSERGLPAKDAAERLERFGENVIVETDRSGWLDVLKDALTDPMIWFLAGTASLFFVLGDYTEAAVLAAALIPIMCMDAYLHRRTKASAEGLSKLLAEHVRVVRGGSEVDIPARSLVPGDLVLTQANAPFPADGVLVGGDNLQVDASALTGESLPVRKAVFTAALAGASDMAVDDTCWAMAGTRLLTGEARMQVVFTGAETLYGQIVRTAQIGTGQRTPLQQAIGKLVAGLLVVAVILCLVLAGVRLAQGFGWVDRAAGKRRPARPACPGEGRCAGRRAACRVSLYRGPAARNRRDRDTGRDRAHRGERGAGKRPGHVHAGAGGPGGMAGQDTRAGRGRAQGHRLRGGDGSGLVGGGARLGLCVLRPAGV